MAKREAAKASSKKGERAEAVESGAVPGEGGAAVPVPTGKAVPGSASKTAAKAIAKKVVTVTVTDIGDHLAATFDIPKSHAKIYLVEAVALIGKHLKKGSKVRLSGLGTLQVKKRAARKARNPNTGEEVKVKAGKRVVFAAAQDFKAKL